MFTACGIKPRRCCLLAASSVLYTTSCKHSLVLLRMGEVIARNMLSSLKLLIKLLLLHLVGCLYYCVSDVQSQKRLIYFCLIFVPYFIQCLILTPLLQKLLSDKEKIVLRRKLNNVRFSVFSQHECGG